MILVERSLSENIYIITAFITAAGSIGLGYFAFRNNPTKVLNKRYFFMNLNVGLWSFLLFLCHVSSSKALALLLNRLLHGAAAFIPITYFHFIIELLGKTEEMR